MRKQLTKKNSNKCRHLTFKKFPRQRKMANINSKFFTRNYVKYVQYVRFEITKNL